MEHWYEKENFDPSLGLLTRCTGCKNSSSNIRIQSPNCFIRRKYKATGTVIPVSKVNATTWRLDVALDTCLQSKSVLDRYRDRESIMVNEIEIERWELELIRRAQVEQNLEEVLVDKLKRNIEGKTKSLRYFTSSIAKANNRAGKVSCGIGWVSYDSRSGNRLDELSLNVDSWPSSLNLELAAFWMICLTVGCDTEVEIISGNEAVLTSLGIVGLNWRTSEVLKRSCSSAVASVLDLVKAKNISLNLTKEEGTSENSPMLNAIQLAKEGMLQSLVLRTESINSDGLLFWPTYEERRLEVPIKQFLKKRQDLKNEAAWWCSEGIKKLEPDVTKKRFYWKAFWNFLKSLNGIWGDSAIKSERKSFLLKSMSENLPVLKVLVERKPELYKATACVLCKTEEDETQDHLATCQVLRVSWEKVEEIALKEAWSMLDKETTRNLKSSALRRAIFGQHDCRQKDVRLAVIKYVFPIEIIEEVQKLGIEHNEGKLLVDKLLFFLWKGFFEIVWKERCKMFSRWKNTRGITSEKKREKLPKKQKAIQKKVSKKPFSSTVGRAKKEKEVKDLLERLMAEFYGSFRKTPI